MFQALARLKTLVLVVLRYQLFELLPNHKLTRLHRRFSKYLVGRKKLKQSAPIEIRLRQALEQLGPVYIKFGQMLSTRHDLITPEMAKELSKLQDRVPGFDSKIAKDTIESQLQRPIQACFASFDEEPLASASVAQIHSAKLKSPEGNMPTEVVVKVIRPGIKDLILKDLALMDYLAGLLTRCIKECRRFHLTQLVRDYRTIILDELDLTLEAANAQCFANNFKNSDLLYVPKVYWPFVREQVMVSERIYGVAVNDLAAFENANVSLPLLAERGAEIFFTQVFRDNFFHADMHPGNIYVDIKDPANPRYIALDCAIVGKLSHQDQWLLGRQLLALMDQDYHQLARLMVLAGWVANSTPLNKFARALERVLAPIFSKPLSEIEFGHLLAQLFATAREFDLQSLPQLMLLEKTLLHVEGLGRQLYPELDIWQIGRPLLENWFRSHYGVEKLMAKTEKALPLILTYLPLIPELVVEKMETQVLRNAQIKTDQAQNQSYNRPILGALGLAFAMLAAYHPQQGFLGWDAPLISFIALGLGLYLLIKPASTR